MHAQRRVWMPLNAARIRRRLAGPPTPIFARNDAVRGGNRLASAANAMPTAQVRVPLPRLVFRTNVYEKSAC